MSALFTCRDSAVALAAATTKTIVQVVPGTKPLALVEWGISFNGATSTNVPVLVELLLQSTAGTSSALTAIAWNDLSEANIFTALKTFTAEPTAGNIFVSYYITPAGGNFVLPYQMFREPVVSGSHRLGIRATAPNVVSCSAYMVVSE